MYVFGKGQCGWRGGLVDERIGFWLYQSCGDMGTVGPVSVFWLRWCRLGVVRGLGPGSGAVGWCYVWILCVDRRSKYLCIVLGGYLSDVYPVLNPIAPYGYLLFDMYLLMANITNPDLFV